jgi:hypothetical protein
MKDAPAKNGCKITKKDCGKFGDYKWRKYLIFFFFLLSLAPQPKGSEIIQLDSCHMLMNILHRK